MSPICHQSDGGIALLCWRSKDHILLFIICGGEGVTYGVSAANITYFYYLQQKKRKIENDCSGVFFSVWKGRREGVSLVRTMSIWEKRSFYSSVFNIYLQIWDAISMYVNKEVSNNAKVGYSIDYSYKLISLSIVLFIIFIYVFIRKWF